MERIETGVPCEEVIALERKWKTRIEQQQYFHFANEERHQMSDAKARQSFEAAQLSVNEASDAMDRHRMQCDTCNGSNLKG